MTVLVTGAGGFLGSRVVERLLARGEAVRAMVRPNSPRRPVARDGLEVVEADLLEHRSLRQACYGARALVHCAANMSLWSRGDREQRLTNVEGTAALYRAAHSHGLERIVHVSTTSAVGASRRPEVLDESASWNLYPLHVGYVNSKHEAEERALSAAWAGMPIVVVNPGAMLGRRPDGGPTSTVARLARGEVRWVPPGRTSVGDVVDTAEACVVALERGSIGERTILGGHNVTWAELYGAVAARLGARRPSLRVPRPALKPLVFAATALDLAGVSRPRFAPEVFKTWGWFSYVDSSKAQAELGYAIRPFDEIVARACDDPAAPPAGS